MNNLILDTDVSSAHHRVILLLDMDCFYAQCETVRLGLDQAIPLALVQWNSALAVNYPARKYGIKRGDSFEVIRDKSKGECIAIHLPVTTIASISPTKNNPTKNKNGAQQTASRLTSPINNDKKVENFKFENGDDGENHQVYENEECSASSSLLSDGGVAQRKVNPYEKNYENQGDDNDKNDKEYDNSENDDSNFEDGSKDDDDDGNNFQSSKSAYEKEFNQPQHIQEEMFKKERNKMRSPKEGKACLDRYRLASARIFSLIEETLTENIGKKNFILERASIDELFIDVTAFCYPPVKEEGTAKKDSGEDDAADEEEAQSALKFKLNLESNSQESLKETNICHDMDVHPQEREDELGKALRLGCHIARTVRRAVFDTLGFTLSAGISTSKLVAKLAASYGKPNGQAVVYPGAIAKVMEDTQIRKARMLGGKLGKKVQSILPDSETTMGAIARLLTLDDLVKAIGDESGRWVFDASRGICHEEVKPTLKVLPKSITAFKSFPTVSYPELDRWTALLASDVMKRVDLDTKRNSRAPKSVTVGYTMTPGGAWIGRTFRLPFPTENDFDARVKKLVDGTRRVLTERGHSSIIRIGFSAIDFVIRQKHGIDSFFAMGKSNASHPAKTRAEVDRSNIITNSMKNARPKPVGIDAFFNATNQRDNSEQNLKAPAVEDDNEYSPEVCRQNNKVSRGNDALSFANHHGLESSLASTHTSVTKSYEQHREESRKMTDAEFARQLQHTFDNEAKNHRDQSTLTPKNVGGIGSHSKAMAKGLSKDEALALQLQSEYDRENRVLSDVERFSCMKKRSNSGSSCKKANVTKRNKIDHFFSNSKK